MTDCAAAPPAAAASDSSDRPARVSARIVDSLQRSDGFFTDFRVGRKAKIAVALGQAGLSRSRTQSPIKLTASVVTDSTTPGSTAIHQALPK